MVDYIPVETLAEVPAHHALHQGEDVALIFEGRVTTFRGFEEGTNRVANALVAAGLKPGSRVVYLGKNSDRFFELLFGAIKAGVVLTPVNWRLAPPEIAYIVDNAEAAMLFVGPELVGAARIIAADRPQLKIVAMEGAEDGFADYARWRDQRSAEKPPHEAKPGDIAIQLYTSGTTGRPKGAMLTHANFLDMRKLCADADIPWNSWQPDDVSLIAMPVAHIGGAGYGIWTLYHGAKGIVAREFDPNAILDFIARDRVNKFFMVPAALQLVVRTPRARQVDYSRVRYIMYGASPIPTELLKECMEVFGCGFVQMYGMTETTGTIVALAPEDHTLDGSPRLRSAGKALPGVEIAILDAAGNPLPVGEVGEIATRSVANMAGYWGMPEATAKTIGQDGFLRTGDAGYLDADGYVYVHDRVKDMIISGGENVYPAEVEDAIYGHPDVAEVAVIGVPSEKWGEEVKAIVAPKPGRSPSPDTIIAWARERIAGFKSPKSVDFIAALPRNASGKILRRELREPYWRGRERQVN